MILLLPILSAYPPSVHHHDWLSSILINGKQKDFFFHIYKFWKIFYKSYHSVINVPPRSYPWRPLSNGNRLQFSWRSNKNPIQLCGILQHSFLFPFILPYNFQLHLALCTVFCLQVSNARTLCLRIPPLLWKFTNPFLAEFQCLKDSP